jgi:hypothetical protein
MPFNTLETIPRDVIILFGWYLFLGGITLAVYWNKRRNS